MEATTGIEATEHHDAYNGHGWLFYDTFRKTWMVEHCIDGRWGMCSLAIDEADTDARTVAQTASRHLRRKRHVFQYRPALCGITHAGEGKKGPKRDA